MCVVGVIVHVLPERQATCGWADLMEEEVNSSVFVILTIHSCSNYW